MALTELSVMEERSYSPLLWITVPIVYFQFLGTLVVRKLDRLFQLMV